jgi:hypothetical protein
MLPVLGANALMRVRLCLYGLGSIVGLLLPGGLPMPTLRLFIDVALGGLAFAAALLALWHVAGRVLATVLTKLNAGRK